MSASSFEADPETLRAMQPEFAELSARMTEAVTALTEVIGKEGACWGTDKPGAAFAKNYVGAARQAQDGLGTIASVLSTLGDNMATIATKINEQDQSSAAALTQRNSEI